MSDDIVEIQVKTSVSLTIRIIRDAAESMLHDELCRVVDDILENAKATGSVISKDRQIPVSYDIGPTWNHVPGDDCELTRTPLG